MQASPKKIPREAITPELLKKHLELSPTGVLLWREPLFPRGFSVRGKRAGCLVRQNVWSDTKKTKTIAHLVCFGGHSLPVARVVLAIHTGVFPKGKIIHKDGNLENVRVENLLEIPAK